MKITKRQLKRIIKEEYSRLKKQGLIKEAFPNYGHDNISPESLLPMAIKEMEKCMVDHSQCKERWWYYKTFVVETFISEMTGVPVEDVRSQDVYDITDDLYDSLDSVQLRQSGLNIAEFEDDAG